MQRYLALLLALIPISLAVLGIKLMRDTVFGILLSPIPALWLQFLMGIFCFAIGFYIFGGFVLYRDRKRNKVQARFRR
ncbi:DUF2627 domain-containing protein [Bacillus sp. Xin]|uniref:DUF2627 domain-containing protein n=1 Tax=unclassified Bacillus (in: firmicutes) TaxID=185979 RepID=UPI00157208BE|nr:MULTISPECIES: DUF2627 domain-containing protein [unclassified Bacillus (in: firmicutes)]MBC6974378.1 DUF2627 domain-containing protein [Bacillus sp. Xin]MCI0763317.1 DUF2627 domain-containing protein [Bacillus sp. TL12]NSW34836.1 DUF2627 domain-containing protein [Bacillus sp. Xin1]